MKITGCQLNFKIGDFEQNKNKILHYIDTHSDSDLIVFSELCLTGYYPMDLIERKIFVAAQNSALDEIIQHTQHLNCGVIVGHIGKNTKKGKPYHNSLALIHRGEIRYLYHKQLLPVYNIFDEARHFTPGRKVGQFEFKNRHLGFLICEDGWNNFSEFNYEQDPVDALAQHNLDAIICINASPSHLEKQQQRLQHFKAVATKCNCPLLFTNQVGGFDNIVFDGSSFVLNQQGETLGQLPQFKEASGTFELTNHIKILDGFAPLKRQKVEAFFYQQIKLGLRDYLDKCSFKGIVISVSGGIDSALTLAIAAKVLAPEQIKAITLPSRYSSKGSITDSQQLCNAFGVELFQVSIDEEFTIALERFKKVFGVSPSPITMQNMQARIRGRILMEYSNQTGYLVISTGNKSELSVGYTTLYGDMSGGFNIIGDLYKTEVYKVAQYFNEMYPNSPIPNAILTKAPSAELAPNQLDEDNLPPYEILDPILKLYIEGDLLPEADFKAYSKVVANIPAELVKNIEHMVDVSEFKRRQAPPIIHVQRRAFGFGRQLPIAAHYAKN